MTIEALLSSVLTLLFALMLLPIDTAYAHESGASLTIEPAQTIVVDYRNKIIKVISNSTVRGHMVAHRSTEDGRIIFINQDIQSQFDHIMASSDELRPGVVYERERGWMERFIEYFNTFLVHRLL